jgi:Ca-activated chloride channel family protein
VHWEIAPCPWQPDHVLARIGLQTRAISARKVPPRNLVFLVDVSGSMEPANKLPLLRRAMTLLVDQLRPQDRVAIVVYAGAAGQVLPPTSGKHRTKIRDALASLQAGGSTHGAEGIRLAYQLAQRSFVRGGINRVILATDGDFNVGATSDGELVRLIERKRKSGVFLSVLGFGEGNLQDAKMELLADKGNGNYAYIDSLHEARKVLIDQAGATLVTVAKDVKLQVEMNPRKVESWRLVGYENRRMADEDFDDDSKDGGELGAGHSVTALYELVPAKSRTKPGRVAPLRYQSDRAATAQAGSDEWLTVKVRSKAPDGEESRLQTVHVTGALKPSARTSDDFRFAAAVAQLGMILRKSKYVGQATLESVARQARAAKAADPGGHRAGFVELVEQIRRLDDGE